MLQFNAMRLEKMDWFGKTSPALWFYRANEDERYELQFDSQSYTFYITGSSGVR